MKFPNRETVERVRREYPAGTRVELVRMDDVQAPPIGTQGTVEGVDDTACVAFRSGVPQLPDELLQGFDVCVGEDRRHTSTTTTAATIC